MGKFHDSRVLSFRQFDKLDGGIYQTYELAWPVEIIECYANKVSEGILDILAETVLQLLNIQEMSNKKICSLLNISEEVVNTIIEDLSRKRLYEPKAHKLTDAGLNYLDKKEMGEFQEDKVFGNMFVSRVDGEVFPYFKEGKLPWGRDYSDILYLSYDEEQPSILDNNKLDFVDRVNNAFHKYGRIAMISKENSYGSGGKTNIEFIKEELIDVSYDEIETLADKETQRNLKNARVKLLNTKPKECYIRFRVMVEKGAPERFVVDSPFPDNMTSWYSECFHRMVSNNELVYTGDEEIGLDYFCENITKQFYIDFPEMQSNSFEQYVKINYPHMLSCRIANTCKEKYKELFNYRLMYENNKLSAEVVVTESTKAIEMILNNYIAASNINRVLQQYKDNIQTDQEVRDLFEDFGLSSDCSGVYKEINYSIMNHRNFKRSKMGNSIAEKYFYLVVEAKFNDSSNFRKLLLSDDGPTIIPILDSIGRVRNKKGGHYDGTSVEHMNKDAFEEFEDNFKDATKLLIEYIG